MNVPLLVAVFIDHYPDTPAPSTCPGCGYEYAAGRLDCPTSTAVRPLLYRRRNEDTTALTRLSPDQMADLHGRRRTTSERFRSVPPSTGSGPSPAESTVGGR